MNNETIDILIENLSMVDYIKVTKEISALQQENKQLKEKFKWKDISEYSRDKYDWVLIKYYLEDEYECVPNVAEMRSDGKWYDINNAEVIFDVKYFFDMQELEKGDSNDE